MPKIKVDGQELEVAPGRKLLDVLEENGTHVPHFCWHPGLKPHGNCRMCLVKVSNSRKLEVSCMYPCSDNLEVTTKGPEIDAARKSVMEFLLINHPLDCPICDKAGECMLQDHTYKYRHGLSRFVEDKVIKETKDLGPTVRIWGNRCISCTRCVRFTEDVSGAGELSLVNRGDHSMADVHPDVPLDNPMSLNVVDICPVGALIDKSFLFQARVWFTERVETTCTSCSRGCNVTATMHKGEVKRLQPRRNDAVNGFWMCDAGRLDIAWLTSEARLRMARGGAKDVADQLRGAKGRIGIILSTSATLEEMFLAKQLAAAVDARIGFVSLDSGTRWVSKSGFAIETDKTANRRGATTLFGKNLGFEDVTAGVHSGDITHLVLVNAIPNFAWPEDIVDASKKVTWLAVADVLESEVSGRAAVVIPSAAWAEKDGTIVNRDGRIQRLRKLHPAPGAAIADATWLQDVLVQLGARKTAVSAEGVFREAFPGLNYGMIGNQGAPLPAAPAETASASVQK